MIPIFLQKNQNRHIIKSVRKFIDRFFKIKKNQKLNMTEQRKIEKFGVGNLYPDIHPPEFSFFKEKCINVALGYDDGFTFTPKFGNFKETEDIFDYLKKYLEDKEFEKLDIRFDTLKTCIYQINPETLKLGELLEYEGSDVEYFEWNKRTKSFDEVDSNSLSDEEEEYFH